jgi:hypothetical protein
VPPALLPASPTPPALLALNAALGGNAAAAVQPLAQAVDDRLRAAATDALARATADDLAPLRARLSTALAMPDDAAMLADLQQILAELPDILREILDDPEAQNVLEDTISAALLNGLATGAVANQEPKP